MRVLTHDESILETNGQYKIIGLSVFTIYKYIYIKIFNNFNIIYTVYIYIYYIKYYIYIKKVYFRSRVMFGCAGHIFLGRVVPFNSPSTGF